MARKVIGLITAAPESDFASRLIDGVCSRCQDYGYELAVFGALCSPGLPQEKFLAGEMNIYNLINFDRLDAVVLDAPSLMESLTHRLMAPITKLLHEKCNKPLVTIGAKVEDYPAFVASDRRVFQEITEHVVNVHHRRNLYFLAGPKDIPESIDRLNGFKDGLAACGLPFEEDKIIYGDFWYFGGANLAKQIIAGELPMPEAIVCASDHMAIGLTKYLLRHGVRVPEDIIVTGFDATNEGIVNQVTISSATPDTQGVAARAIDHLRGLMEPGAQLAPFVSNAAEHLALGMSCGCNFNVPNIMATMRESVYNISHDFSDANDAVDIGLLLESNMTEYMSDTTSPQECIEQIFLKTYLLRPYRDFYLCLDENWLNAELCAKVGYPSRIKLAVHTTPQLGSGHCENGPLFDTAQMIPQLHEQDREASIFYFVPVHFLDHTMGYAVLRYGLEDTRQVTCIVRNWLKNVNSGLHIARTAHRLESLSTRDGMTGAYNRRGMELMLDHMLQRAQPDDSVLAFVIDMDRLKFINDTFGHADGDACITAISNAAMRMTNDGELYVRAGGDEFYVIGIGSYEATEAQRRIDRFYAALDAANAQLNKPYQLSASVGSACIPLASSMTVMGIIRIADAKMYENKVQKKVQRKD